jgi:glutathione synthase
MSLTVAVQMDPIEGIDITKDSTFLLMLEAQGRGHRLLYYHPSDLSLRDNEVFAAVRPVRVENRVGHHYTLGEVERVHLGEVADIVLLRQDPPFNMRYITNTHLLERVMETSWVLNNPIEVRNAPEKLLVCYFPELMSSTLISEDWQAIADFSREHGDIVLKPLYGHGGSDVFRLRQGEEGFDKRMAYFKEHHPYPVIAQRYIPEITKGDKRIILIDGEPVGAVSRIPQEGNVRANLHEGGTAQKTTLTPRDRAICARIGGTLKERGLFLVGIDVIGEYLTEINVTSPTGFHEINRLDGVRLEKHFWEVVEKKWGERPGLNRRPPESQSGALTN